MATQRFSDEQYHGRRENNPDISETQRQEVTDAGGAGYYQYLSLEEMVNNFMATFVGVNKAVPKVNRGDVEFHLRRGIRELNYDVATEVKELEFAITDSFALEVPQDLVSIVEVLWVDNNGYYRPIPERRYSGNPRSPQQADDGRRLYDDQGNLLYDTDSSTARTRYDENTRELSNDDGGRSVGSNYNYSKNDSSDTNYAFEGRIYNTDPELANINGTYVFDQVNGLIIFDSTLSEFVVGIKYISDGDSTDASEIRAHKFLEDTLYKYVISVIIDGRRDYPLYEKQLARKRYISAKKTAKIRLSNINPRFLRQVLKQASKWIRQ